MKITHEDHDLLLGLDWFQSTGAGLFSAEKILKFPSQKIYLGNSIEPDDKCAYIMYVESSEDNGVVDEIEENELTPPEKDNFQPAVELMPNDALKFKLVIQSMILIAAYSLVDLKSCTIGKHAISLINKNQSPIYIPPYPKSRKEREIMANEVETMLENGIIGKSKSPWSSPVVLVGKKDGSIRFCLDYRKLNSVTVTEIWPIPRILDILNRLAGSRWFSTLDLIAGYWQILLEELAIEPTAFSTPDGHYEFARMPFGLKNAPSTFSRIMHQPLGNLDFVEIYFDDITIHSKTLEAHFT